jgi:3-deoxy-D-manno-octulosonic-acid transferase
MCNKLGLKYSLRSHKTKNNILKNDLYIVNSFGELGLFYSLADITFIGGSFKMKSRIAGHNLLEPAYFENVIIVGPNMGNFQNITNEMLENKACIQINTSEELKNQILFFMEDKNRKIYREYSDNAKRYVKSKQKILGNYLQQIDIFFND